MTGCALGCKPTVVEDRIGMVSRHDAWREWFSRHYDERARPLGFLTPSAATATR